jgi:hypothetical protein
MQAALVLMCLATSAPAAAVEPKKPSDLVLLDATLGFVDPQPPCPAGSRLVNARVLADGTTEPFAIPAKQVLVVTAANFYAEGVADRNYEFAVFVAGGAALVHANARSDPAGQVVAGVTIPDGVVVRAGAALCANAGNLATGAVPSFVRRHGDFAKDR